jgi:hypothetical protein
MQDLLLGISWSLIGFVGGWLVGREMLYISQIREAVVPKAERERTNHTVTSGQRSRLLGFIVVLLALFSVLQGALFTWDVQKKSECQAQFNSDFAQVATRRALWADEDKAALVKMLTDALNGATPEIRRKAVQDYLDTIEKTDRLRAENPIPKLQDRNC